MATSPRAVPKAPAKAAAEAVAQPAAKSGNKLVLILAIVILLAAGGGGAWFFLGQQNGANAAAKKADPAKPPVFMVMEPFTVNLQPDGMGDQYLQVAFSLQVPDETDAETIKLYLPQVRSRLLLLLSGKKAAEISTIEGKKQLADEIIAQVKQPFAPGAAPQNVTNVFFTSFVIQ